MYIPSFMTYGPAGSKFINSKQTKIHIGYTNILLLNNRLLALSVNCQDASRLLFTLAGNLKLNIYRNVLYRRIFA